MLLAHQETRQVRRPDKQKGFMPTLPQLAELLSDSPHLSPLIREELNAALKDAERYRWTRDQGCNFVWAEIGAGNCRKGLDEAIDRAMGAISQEGSKG
jgi:hypothetical protein